MPRPAYIAIDWGSSAFRAFLIGVDGTILAEVLTKDGVFTVQNGDFEAVLSAHCQAWLKTYGALPIIMSGMVGSRNGWQEVPYTACPVSPLDLMEKFTHIKASIAENIILVPGVSGVNASGAPDVMRGEEVQIFGALKYFNIKNAIVCLPGTHSKWCIVTDGKIESFSTYMTGEIFNLLSAESSLAALMISDNHDETSFRAGLQQATASQDLLGDLFAIRAAAMVNEVQYASPYSFLSGLLIGNEIKSALKHIDTSSESPPPIVLVGNSLMNKHYSAALNCQNIAAKTIDSNLAFLAGVQVLMS